MNKLEFAAANAEKMCREAREMREKAVIMLELLSTAVERQALLEHRRRLREQRVHPAQTHRVLVNWGTSRLE